MKKMWCLGCYPDLMCLSIFKESTMCHQITEKYLCDSRLLLVYFPFKQPSSDL